MPQRVGRVLVQAGLCLAEQCERNAVPCQVRVQEVLQRQVCEDVVVQ
jgi:hypothetical protein